MDRVSRARELAEAALAAVDGIALGPPGGRDVDVFARPEALEAARAALAAAGMLALDGLFERLYGAPSERDSARFAALDGAEVLALVEVQTRLWPGGPPLPPGTGRTLPPELVERRRAAKRARRTLARRARGAARERLRGRQLRVAFCGIDGAGKSTQVQRLAEALQRLEIPVRTSWVRLGNRPDGVIAGLARLGQRALPAGSHSYQAQREATGGAAAPGSTRRGALGWGWALAVTLDYLKRTRAAARRARGHVLVLDRALPDALVELADDYGVVLELRLQRALLERLTPAPDHVFHLRLDGATAKARKDDTFTAAELDAHVVRYEALLGRLEHVESLDARRPPAELTLATLRTLAAATRGTPHGPSR